MSQQSHTQEHDRVRLSTAQARLREVISSHGRVETIPPGDADGRVLAADLAAQRAVPHYRRAAMDGFAIRAADVADASETSPVTLALAEEGGPGRAVPVHTGSPLPEDADTVVRLERARERGGRIEVSREIPRGKDVAPVGEDVRAGEALFAASHRLRPSDLGLLRATGVTEVPVSEPPEVAVLPTGDEVVERDPAPGETVETNGVTVSQYVTRWGGNARRRDVVPDEVGALSAAIETDLDADLVVTTGGSSVGARDLVPEAVESVGELCLHGIAHKPGHPAGFGVVRGTPVILLPGYPVSAIVNAVQLLRPAMARLVDRTPDSPPTVEARLTRAISSEPGTRRYERVRLDESDPPEATPVAASGAGVLSSVALADGWVVVPENETGTESGETVVVEDWEPAF